MATLAGRPPLFRDSFDGDSKPRGFTLLIRPTAKEFFDFVLLLDQALSDNINKNFFRGEVALEEERERKDGRIEVRQRGTLALLEDWVRSHFRPADPGPIEIMFQTLRKVRTLRQKPAHRPVNGEFDQKYFREQRALIMDAYEAVRTLRLILKNHPACKTYTVEDCLEYGRIRSF